MTFTFLFGRGGGTLRVFFFSSIGPHRDARSKVGKRSADICSAKTKQKRCPPPQKVRRLHRCNMLTYTLVNESVAIEETNVGWDGWQVKSKFQIISILILNGAVWGWENSKEHPPKQQKKRGGGTIH